MIRDSSALDVLGSPRDFSTARYATVCETSPMPWDPGTPIDQRPAVVAAADRGAAGEHVRAVRPAGRRRGRDRPLPALAGRPAPALDGRAAAVPDRADPDPPGRRGPAHAARGLRARRGPDPGLGAARRARHGPLDRQRPAHLLRRRDRPLHRAASRCRSRLQADPDRHPGGRSAPRSRSTSLRVLRRAAAQGRADRARARRHARRPPAGRSRRRRSATSGGGLRGGSWSIRGDRLVLKRYEAVDGVTRHGSGNSA